MNDNTPKPGAPAPQPRPAQPSPQTPATAPAAPNLKGVSALDESERFVRAIGRFMILAGMMANPEPITDSAGSVLSEDEMIEYAGKMTDASVAELDDTMTQIA